MIIGTTWLFLEVGDVSWGVLIIAARLFGVYIRAAGFWETPIL